MSASGVDLFNATFSDGLAAEVQLNPESLANTILQTIPNRMAYFDSPGSNAGRLSRSL